MKMTRITKNALTLTIAILTLIASVYATGVLAILVAGLLFPHEWARDAGSIYVAWLILEVGVVLGVLSGALIVIFKPRKIQSIGVGSVLSWYGLIVSFIVILWILLGWEEIRTVDQVEYAVRWGIVGLGCWYFIQRWKRASRSNQRAA